MAEAGRRRLLKAAIAAGVASQLSACEREDGGDEPGVRVGDIAGLDRTRVAGVVRPSGTAGVVAALATWRGPVCVAGGRFSMGGQTRAPDALQLDMARMDRLIELDADGRRVRVQAGIRWRALQELLDPHDLSVKVMQSYSNFSVGGSVSVNCHGRYVGNGAIAGTVRALQLVTAGGQVLELSRQQHADLFAAVLGGYGALGIVTEVELDLARNARIARHAARVSLDDYPAWFHANVLEQPDVVLHNADLVPPSFDAPLTVSWRQSDAPLTDTRRLMPAGADYGREQNLIWAASELPGGDRVRERFLTDRLLGEPRVVMRNLEASLDTASLEPRTRRMSTYLLQEYFVPVAHFATFARKMASVLRAHDVQALNVSIRHAPADTTSLLRWAPQDVFCFVLYHKQRIWDRSEHTAGRWTRALIDTALSLGGRHYLPYRLHATPEQFLRAYPEVEAFAAIKRRLDPGNRFRNLLWDHYLPRA
jgi:FAD/FMN-containing dehydrogenase